MLSIHAIACVFTLTLFDRGDGQLFELLTSRWHKPPDDTTDYKTLIPAGDIFFINETIREPIFASESAASGDVIARLRMRNAKELRLQLDCDSDYIVCLNQKLINDVYLVELILRQAPLFDETHESFVAIPYKVLIQSDDKSEDFTWRILEGEQPPQQFFIVKTSNSTTKSVEFAQPLYNFNGSLLNSGKFPLKVTDSIQLTVGNSVLSPTVKCLASNPADACGKFGIETKTSGKHAIRVSVSQKAELASAANVTSVQLILSASGKHGKNTTEPSVTVVVFDNFEES